MADTGSASVNAEGWVGVLPEPSGRPPGFRSLKDVEAAVSEHGGDVEAVIVALGGSAARLVSLDDWDAFRESCGLNLSDAALWYLCQAADV